jgi:hypothetical protein
MRNTQPGTSILRSALAAAALLAGCGEGKVYTTSAEPHENRPEALVIAGLHSHVGRQGEPLADPFVVRVTDIYGDGVAGVVVRWRVTSGVGEFFTSSGQERATSRTGAQGFAEISFTPAVAGTTTVEADVSIVPALRGAPVSFTVDAYALAVIDFGPMFDCPEPSVFSGPDTVRVRTVVRWVYANGMSQSCEARIVSVSAPPGEPDFDSGTLAPHDIAELVPGVAGTWWFVDKINGGSRKLTVTP